METQAHRSYVSGVLGEIKVSFFSVRESSSICIVSRIRGVAAAAEICRQIEKANICFHLLILPNR